MNKPLRILTVGAAAVAGLAVAPAPHAQDYLSTPHASIMGEGMMGQGDVMGMVGSMMSGVMNLMGMSGGMGDMSGMMEHCSEMMQGIDGRHADRPNDQWRPPQPAPPGQSQG